MALRFLLAVAVVPLLAATQDAADYPDLGENPFPVDLYDYDEYNYQDGVPYHTNDNSLDSMKNATIKKCFCEASQEWDGIKCYDEATIVAVTNLEFYSLNAYNTTDFGRVTITGPPQCTYPSLPIVLDSNKHFSFTLLSNGSLLWNTIFTEYCVEHTPIRSWIAHICLPPPPVRTCCPPGHDLAEDNSCVPRNAGSTFSPPVLVESEVMEWEAREIGPTEVDCSGKSNKLRLVLDDKNASLLFISGDTILKWVPPRSHGTAPANYCVSKQSEQYVANFCYLDPLQSHNEACQNNTCVRKCCREGEYHTSDGCLHTTNVSQLLNPVFYEYQDGQVVQVSHDHGDIGFKYVAGYPICEEYFLMEPHKTETDEFYLMTDGTLYLPAFSDHYEADRYCIENFEDEQGVTRTLPLVCFQESAQESKACIAMQSYLYPILLLVSCVFLGITLLIYVSVPELHAKVHGKCLVSHVSALLFAYCSLITVKWATTSMPNIACKIMASVIHMSFLAAFFWLNVMCFDIWWTLKSMRPVAESGEQSRFRFKMYSIYSWGCPLLIAIVSIVIQELPDELGVIKPDFGTTKCWFDNNTSLWLYFYGFVLVLVVANIVFFCQVAYILIMAQNDPILQRTRQQNRERMWLYVKLFLVMGITWLAEVISWQEGSCEAWILTDMINSLQGFSIFLIFICKKNMLKKIRCKWDPYLRRMKDFVGSTRLSQSGGASTSQVHSTFSSSSQRPSDQSQRTVQSQISLDSSSTRRLSASSLAPVTGAQVHSHNKIPMNTIAEACHPEAESEKADSVASFPGSDSRSKEEQRHSSSSGNSTTDETSQMISHPPVKVLPENSLVEEDGETSFFNSEDTGGNQDLSEPQKPDENDAVPEPGSETVQSVSEERLYIPVKDDTKVTCVLPSENQDEEPITINGEKPQFNSTVVRIDDDGPAARNTQCPDLNTTHHIGEQDREDSGDTEGLSEYQGRQSLGFYDDDEQPVSV